jgi:hypothetical protein
LFFTKNERAEAVNGCSFLPLALPKASLFACFFEKTLAVPPIRSGDLRQEQTPVMVLADEESVLPDLNFGLVLDRFHQGEDRYFEIDAREFVEREWRESWISDRSSNGAFGRTSIQGFQRMHIPDAASQFAVFMDRYEYSVSFSQRSQRRLGQRQGL